MKAFESSSITVEVSHAPNPLPNLVAVHVMPKVVQPSSAPPREWQGSIVVQDGLSIAPVGRARMPAAFAAVGAMIPPRHASVWKRQGLRSKTQEAGRKSNPANATSNGFHNATAEFVHLLHDNTVGIEQALVGYYGYNVSNGDVHDHTKEKDGIMKVDKATFDQKQAKNGARSKNYTPLEDQIFIKAWEVVSLDATISTDQTGRWDIIKPVCSRWIACSQQVRNAPPSGTVESYYEKNTRERYKDMEASCGRSFNLEHCWKLLQHSQKWKLIEKKKSPLKKVPLTEMDDDEEVDDSPRNKNKTHEDNKAMNKIKRESEASSLGDKIDIMMQPNKVLVIKTLEMKKKLAEKKAQEKQEKWILLKEEGLHKTTIEERKALIKEKRSLAKLLTEKNKIMTMNRNGMDDITKRWLIWQGRKS
ncbi:Lactation elevated protein 1 [Hordeum vulgare]|nr:Lactation elevated protein 1 [Hordeum vulgare]